MSQETLALTIFRSSRDSATPWWVSRPLAYAASLCQFSSCKCTLKVCPSWCTQQFRYPRGTNGVWRPRCYNRMPLQLYGSGYVCSLCRAPHNVSKTKLLGCVLCVCLVLWAGNAWTSHIWRKVRSDIFKSTPPPFNLCYYIAHAPDKRHTSATITWPSSIYMVMDVQRLGFFRWLFHWYRCDVGFRWDVSNLHLVPRKTLPAVQNAAQLKCPIKYPYYLLALYALAWSRVDVASKWHDIFVILGLLTGQNVPCLLLAPRECWPSTIQANDCDQWRK